MTALRFLAHVVFGLIAVPVLLYLVRKASADVEMSDLMLGEKR